MDKKMESNIKEEVLNLIERRKEEIVEYLEQAGII